ncbi:MAG: MarR family transcriptional regulator [Rhodobiaceae bacterium]|nr:MarR family transcriptional regulator [Rhodobiaceae bacterium]
MARTANSFDLDKSLSHLLRRTQQYAYDLFTQNLSKTDLTPRQFVVLLAVSEEEGLSQTDLVNRTGIDRSTLADMISRMIKRGLLARQRTAQDARANSVRLTAAGRKALNSAQPKASAAEETLLALIPKTVQKDLLRTLTQLSNAVQAAKQEADATPVRKTTAKKAPAKKAVTKKTAAKKAPAKKAATKKTVAKKAAVKKIVAKKAPAKKATAKKAPAKKTAAKKAPAKKAKR